MQPSGLYDDGSDGSMLTSLKLRQFRGAPVSEKLEPPVSVLVIVLSYNCKDDTLECIASVIEQTYPNLGLMLVDNASSDGAVTTIFNEYPNIALIALSENIGWAGGNNLGIRVALENKYEFVVLLNSDTVLSPTCIELLVKSAQSLGPCLLHPAIYYYGVNAGAQLDPSSTDPQSRERSGSELFELDFAYGACLMVQTDVFRRVGLFDERFFLQLEETDFFFRARKVGFKSFCFTGTRIYHKESRSFGGRRTPVKTYYMVRNTLLITEKHCRTPRQIGSSIKQLYWSLVSLKMNGEAHRSPQEGFLSWLLSGDPFALAARLGIRDYALRRFGRIGDSETKALAFAARAKGT
jgi:GT2 family glycosyltransferase